MGDRSSYACDWLCFRQWRMQRSFLGDGRPLPNCDPSITDVAGLTCDQQSCGLLLSVWGLVNHCGQSAPSLFQLTVKVDSTPLKNLMRVHVTSLRYSVTRIPGCSVNFTANVPQLSPVIPAPCPIPCINRHHVHVASNRWEHPTYMLLAPKANL
jgi:hypothetical protein